MLVEPSPREVELEHLFMRPESLRQGIGRELLEHAAARCRSRGFARLKIISDPNAVGFYENLGAIVVGQHHSRDIPGRVIPVLQIEL